MNECDRAADGVILKKLYPSGFSTVSGLSICSGNVPITCDVDRFDLQKLFTSQAITVELNTQRAYRIDAESDG